ncbi:hypothetical protein PENTCL1PPCAC_14664, partial [Pristionchus entomophagus]
ATPLIVSVAHYAVCCSGMLVNAVLMLVIITSTPPEMRTYSTVLFTSATVDCLTSLSWGAVLVSEAFAGLCTQLDSVGWCLYPYAFALGGNVFFAFNIALCFSFRYH